MANSDFMYVKSGDAGRVGMAEVDDKHPGGSVMVGDQCRKVGKTPFAMYQLRGGMLVECSGSREKSAADKFAAEAVKSNPRPDATVADEVAEDEAVHDDSPAQGDINTREDKSDGKAGK